MRTVILIPARSGSQRVVDKNFREILGESLLTRAARVGISSGLATFVSTDDPIRAAAHVPSHVHIVERPRRLAASNTPIEDVITHFASHVGLGPRDRVLLLQPTSPLRTTESLAGFVAACDDLDPDHASAFSATADYGDFWYSSPKEGSRRIRDLLPSNYVARQSQHREPLLRENGLYYLCSIEFLRRNKGLVGSASRVVMSPASEDLDIDDPADWKRAEILLQGN
jgi:CMP-N-acetylneuraminic acid synthetase